MLFIDFSCLTHQYIYNADQDWKKFWFDRALQHQEIPFRFVSEQHKISMADLPPNCEGVTLKTKKISGLFGSNNAFANAVKSNPDIQKAIWITNQISHMPGGDSKQLLWIDDLEWLRFPQWQMQSREKVSKKDWIKKSKNIASAVVFSNHYAGVLKNDLVIPETGIHVFPHIDDDEIKPATWTEKESVKTEYSKGNDYFVFAGDIHNRHHIISLLKAYSIFKKWQKSSMQLIIIGSTTEHTAGILQSIESYKHRDDVVIITDPAEEEKIKIIAGAYACLHTAESTASPTIMINAMKAGVPVIVSDIPNLREWGLEHVLYANAADETQIAEKMILLFKDETLRSRLIENAAHFVATNSDNKNSASLFNMLHSLFPANFAATIK